MSCLNLRRLLPTRKIWKLFSTKLQTNFHKVLNRSKVIKKSKNPHSLFCKDSKKLALSPIFRVQFKTKRSNTKFKYKSKSKPTFKYKKKSAPVYIDQLFIENTSVVKDNFVTAKKKDDKQVCIMETKQDDMHQGESSGTNGENYSNDEMWESLTLASPQLHCINERAEEFIARFRADMRRQENMLAQRL